MLNKPKLDVSEAILVRHLESLFKVKNSFYSLADYIASIDDNWHDPLPFCLSDICVVYEKLAVIPSVLFPKNTSKLHKYFDNVGEQALLVTDSRITGVDGLYVVAPYDDKTSINGWTSKLKQMNVIINEYKDRYVVASPLKAFIK